MERQAMVGGGGPAAAAAQHDTAPLPRRSGLVVALAVLIVVQTAAIGGYFFYQEQQKRQAQLAVQSDADQRFSAAMAAFEAQRWPEAAAAFDELVSQWNEHPKLGVASRGYALLSLAQQEMASGEQAMLESRFEQSLAHYQSAATALATAAGLEIDPQARLIGLIEKARDEQGTRQAFVSELGSIARSVAAADFENARRQHRKLREFGQVLKGQERRQLDEMGAQIEDQAAQHEIEQIDRRARDLLLAGNLGEARAELDAALKKFASSSKLRERLMEVMKQTELERSIAEARLAESRGQLPEAVLAYQHAEQIQPDAERATKIAQLRSHIAFEEGQKFEAEERISAAAARYEQAHSLWANPAALERLKELKLAGDKTSVLRAADTAVAAADFEQAAALYRKALEISPDPETQNKLNDATVSQHIKTAIGHLDRGDLAGARGELEKALAVNPTHEDAKLIMAELDIVARYHQFIAEGDKLRSASDFVGAKDAYQRAVDLARRAEIDGKEAAQRKLDTEYDHLLALARSAITAGDWIQARGFLTAAQRMRSTEQVMVLLDEVERHAAKKQK